MVWAFMLIEMFDFRFSIDEESDSNGICGLKRNGTQMTQIDMIDMIYCEASLWEILFDILILILNGHACPAHAFICFYSLHCYI